MIKQEQLTDADVRITHYHCNTCPIPCDNYIRQTKGYFKQRQVCNIFPNMDGHTNWVLVEKNSTISPILDAEADQKHRFKLRSAK